MTFTNPNYRPQYENHEEKWREERNREREARIKGRLCICHLSNMDSLDCPLHGLKAQREQE